MKEYPGFCQSCSMPLDRPELRGTEIDGSLSADYCKYCYTDGHFTIPAMTLESMQSHITGNMDADGLPADIVETAVARLPLLKRWRPRPVSKIAHAEEPTTLSPEEKHPLEKPPLPGPLFSSEAEADKIPDEETEMSLAEEPPKPGEAP
jgi:hypothetical protein